MKIKCTSCGYREEVNTRLFIRIIGGVMPFGGYWAWVTYFFAGTGFAMPIVIAIMTGGVALLVFQNEITTWICNQQYKCEHCGKHDWKAES
ncbi:hypothetical protein [Moraxella nonliquefaciens]|jgi:hypothetical protein|nr:hypothetical protein [Moraxella nonliquefaciens]MCG7412493.1 hypothetical protein [Moraxella nonliquefaciens]